MSDAKSTQECYLGVCKQEKAEASREIVYILQRLQDEHFIDPHIESQITLNGNKRNECNEVYRKRLEDNDVYVLYQTLKENTYVVGLDLSYNRIGNVGAKHIKDLLLETLVLRDLDLSFNDIGPEGGEDIAKGLQINDTLRTLNLNGNKIGNIGGMALANVLQVNTTLFTISLGSTDLDTDSVIAFSTILNSSKSLKNVNLNRPLLFSVQEETTVHLANMLKSNSTLTDLHLSKHSMTNYGIERIAASLMDNIALTYLDISSNKISRDGAGRIAWLLAENTPLEYLNLASNRIEDDGAVAISKALAMLNTSLHTIVLCNNSIGTVGLCAVVKAMQTNVSLQRVFVWGNQFAPPVCEAFKNLQEAATPRFTEGNIDVQVYTVDGNANLANVTCSY